MGKNIFILVFAVLVLAGCRSSNAVLVPSGEGIVSLAIRKGNATATIRKQERKDVHVDFQVEGPAHLHATIAPVGTPEGNLRISTITLPDGSTDGPWGRELDYDIPASGLIRLDIGESLMQGDPWGGDFTIEVKLVK